MGLPLRRLRRPARPQELAAFKFDYTFFLNLAAVAAAGALVVLSRRHVDEEQARPARTARD